MSGHISNRTVTIILATVVPSLVLIALAGALYFRVRKRQSLFDRGITPIDDEEIESWKVDRPEEKGIITEPSTPARASNGHSRGGENGSSNYSPKNRRHEPGHSVGSIQKPPSVIVYQNISATSPRISGEQSPRFLSTGKRSMELPQTPVLARAPNARPGLTDETVQGEDAFITQVKRHPSRLAKTQPSTPRHNRSRSSRSAYEMTSGHGSDQWYGRNSDLPPSPRRSTDTYARASRPDTRGRSQTHSHTHSSPQAQALFDDDMCLGGLSPRPLIHKSEIGRAIG